MTDVIQIAVDAIFGGGLLVTLYKVFTLKHDIAKAREEAETIRLNNEEKSLNIIKEYVVEPLKTEINGLRKEMARFRNAVSKINNCRLADNCPVQRELSKQYSADESEAGDSNNS